MLLALSSPAVAEEPWMWGAGVATSVSLVPTTLPDGWPDTPDAPDSAKVGVAITGLASVWVTEHLKLDGFLTFEGRRKGLDIRAVVAGNYAFDPGPVQIFAGGGLGVGRLMGWDESGARYHVPNLPIRLQAGGVYTRPTFGVHWSLFGLLRTPLATVYRDPEGQRQDAGLGFDMSLHLEVGVLFGDLLRPRVRVKKGSS